MDSQPGVLAGRLTAGRMRSDELVVAVLAGASLLRRLRCERREAAEPRNQGPGRRSAKWLPQVGWRVAGRWW